MEQKKFEDMLILLVPQIITRISDHMGWDEMKAISKFYASQVYALLEEEETKLWHLSPLTLCRMFEEEIKTGSVTFPEEV